MNEIRLRLMRGDRYEWEPRLPSKRHRVVDVIIDRKRLVELAAAVEQPFAEKEGHPELAGDYEGCPPSVIFLPSRHYFGQGCGSWVWDPDLYDGKSVVLQCKGCGETGCWPLVAKITGTSDNVIWSAFEQIHRGGAWTKTGDGPKWFYDGLGPFVFDRRQYEEALRDPRGPGATGR